MAGFLDNFRWPECECIDWSERRNAIASIVAGVLVSFERMWVVSMLKNLEVQQSYNFVSYVVKVHSLGAP